MSTGARSLRPLAAVFVTAVLQSACWVTTEQGQTMEADIVKLKADNLASQQDAQRDAAEARTEHEKLHAEQDAQLTKVEAKVQEVNATLDSLRRTATKSGADLADQQSRDEEEIARLRGAVEEAQAKNAALEQQIATLQTDLQTRVASLEKRQTSDETKAAAEPPRKLPPAPVDPPKSADEPKLDKEETYKLAKKKLDAEDYVAARELFGKFIAKWKSDPMSGSAQFWIAESYYAQKDYRRAGLEFQKVCDSYPKSEKAPDAELKVGYSFLELNMKNEAKSFFQTVVDTYPKLTAAKKAKEKLADLAKHK